MILMASVILLIMAKCPDDEMDDAADHQEHREEREEPGDAVDHVIKFHGACPIVSLADLDRECERHDDREHEQKRHCDRVSVVRKPEKYRMNDENHQDSKRTDYEKVQFLIGEAVLDLVV